MYHISVTRAGEGDNVALVVDGHAIDGKLVPPPVDGRKEVAVAATLS
jgi:cellobiose phosphorylase